MSNLDFFILILMNSSIGFCAKFHIINGTTELNKCLPTLGILVIIDKGLSIPLIINEIISAIVVLS